MKNFMKIIIGAIKTWVIELIENSRHILDLRISESKADWNENNPDSDSYVKNRPFYEESNILTLVPETVVTIDSSLFIERAIDIELVIGNMYTVIWDGQAYECVCYDCNGPVIGNSTCWGSNGGNGEPFLVSNYDDLTAINAYKEGTYTISIIVDKTIIHKIDSKFFDLSDDVATFSDLQAVSDVANSAQNLAETAHSLAESAKIVADNAQGLVESAQTSANEAKSIAQSAKNSIDGKMNSSNPTGTGSFSMGRKSGTTIGTNSHAEGANTTASGKNSHAEGNYTTASGEDSHAEGYATIASAWNSHAEGQETKVTGMRSHAEGLNTEVSGECSHAEGKGTIAASDDQHVQGRNNIKDTLNQYAHIVGNGITLLQRSNAHTLDWDGNAWYQGDIYTGGTSQDDAEAKKIATEEYVDNKIQSFGESFNKFILPPFDPIADEGKILKIVNGVPTWVAIPNAEEASF